MAREGRPNFRMAIRFRSPIMDPNWPPRGRVNWRMVRLAFTTRDGWAYLIQTLLLLGTFALALWMGWDFFVSGSVQSLVVAVWLYLLALWPMVRRGIRFQDWG